MAIRWPITSTASTAPLWVFAHRADRQRPESRQENRLKSYRTARSALPAVVRDPAGPCRESGKTGFEWRDSHALRDPHRRSSRSDIGRGPGVDMETRRRREPPVPCILCGARDCGYMPSRESRPHRGARDLAGARYGESDRVGCDNKSCVIPSFLAECCAMTNLLITWIGRADLRAADDGSNGTDGPGPIAQALAERSYDSAVLISDYAKEDVAPFLEWLRPRVQATVTACHEPLSGPTQFGEIYEAAVRVLTESLEHHGKNAGLTFHLSPGPPQWRRCGSSWPRRVSRPS